jgi:hypothetical protein
VHDRFDSQICNTRSVDRGPRRFVSVLALSPAVSAPHRPRSASDTRRVRARWSSHAHRSGRPHHSAIGAGTSDEAAHAALLREPGEWLVSSAHAPGLPGWAADIRIRGRPRPFGAPSLTIGSDQEPVRRRMRRVQTRDDAVAGAPSRTSLRASTASAGRKSSRVRHRPMEKTSPP